MGACGVRLVDVRFWNLLLNPQDLRRIPSNLQTLEKTGRLTSLGVQKTSTHEELRATHIHN